MDKFKSNPLKRGKRSDKPVQSKKKKCEGGACSTFFADLTRKFKIKKKAKEDTNNNANSIQENIIKILPVEVPRTLEMNTSVQESSAENNVQRETTFSHEPDDDRLVIKDDDITPEPPHEIITKTDLKPKNLRPLFINPEIVKNNSMQTDINVKNIKTSSILVNNGPTEHVTAKMEPNAVGMKEQDIAGELTKHVATLRKISLIADEFNKKTDTMNSTVECPYKSPKYNEIRRKWKTNSDKKNKLIDNKKQDYKNAETIAETSNQAPYNTNDKNIKGSDFKIKPSLIPRPISKKATLNTKESNESRSIRIQNLVQEIHHLKITQDAFETEVQRVDLARPIPNIDSEIDLQNNNIFIDQEFVISEMSEINYDTNDNEDLKKCNIESDPNKQIRENTLDDTKEDIDDLPKPLESINISDESAVSKIVNDVINHTLDESITTKLADDFINQNNDMTSPKSETQKKKSIHVWDSRGRCKRCHMYKIGHKPRKGRLMLMMRMSIGRICKQRLYEAWRKTADHFVPRPRFKLPKSSIMIHIEKSLVWTKDIPRSYTEMNDTAKEAENKPSTEMENWSLKPDAIKNDTAEPTQTSKHSLNNGENPKVGPSIFRLPDPRTVAVPTRMVVSSTNQSSLLGMAQGYTDPLVTYQDNDTQTTKYSNKTIGVFGMEQILLNEKSNYVTETTVPCRRLENTLVTKRGTVLTCTGTRITSLSPVASVYHLQHTMDTIGLSAWFTRRDDQNPTTVQRVCCLKDVCLGFQDLRNNQSTSFQRSLLDIKDTLTTTSTSTSGLCMVKSVCLSEVFNGKVVETNEVHCFTQYNEYSPELALLSRSELMSVRLLDSVREMAIEAKPLTCDRQVDEFVSLKSAEVVMTPPIAVDKSISTLDLGIEKDTQYEVLETTANPRQKGGRSPADFVISSNLNAQKWMDGYRNNPESLNLSQVTVNELLDRAFTTSASRAPGVPQNAYSCVAMEKEDSSASKTDITNSPKTSENPFRNVSNVTTKDNISGPVKRSSKSSINIVLKLSRRHKRDCVISINFDAQNAQHIKRK